MNLHECTLAYMIPIPALVCPRTCDSVAKDALRIANHHSISHVDLIDKKEGGSCFRAEKTGRTCSSAK